MSPNPTRARTPRLIDVLELLARNRIETGREMTRLGEAVHDRKDFIHYSATPDLDLDARHMATKSLYGSHPILRFFEIVERYGGPGKAEMDALSVRVESRYWLYPDEDSGAPGASQLCRRLNDLDGNGTTEVILDRLFAERIDARELLRPLLGNERESKDNHSSMAGVVEARLEVAAVTQSAAPPDAADDESAYRPAKEFLQSPHDSYKALRSVLNKNKWIRWKQRSPRRYDIHAADWMKYLSLTSLPPASDSLEIDQIVVQAALDAQKETEKIRAEKKKEQGK